jgi:prephenate dehydrogenase
MHAKAALDEMKELTKEFKILTDNTSVKTPNIAKLSSYIS